MIQEVNDSNLYYFNNILKSEFNSLYEKNTFSKDFVFISENELVGIISYSLIYDRIELNYIYVNNNKRNMGIASKLMLHMIEEGIRNNIKNITLEVNVNNKEAISLYEKFGFVVVAVRPNYYNGEDGYLMIRE